MHERNRRAIVLLTMRLVTAKEAAKTIKVSEPTISYWARTGKIKKYPRELSPGRRRETARERSNRWYLVDLDEILSNGPGPLISEVRDQHPDLRLLTVRQVSKIIDRGEGSVRYYMRRFGLHKYRYGNNGEYLIDGDELADAFEANGLEHLVR